MVGLKDKFLISNEKHILWVLKRTLSMRWIFLAPKTHVKINGKENILNFMFKKIVWVCITESADWLLVRKF